MLVKEHFTWPASKAMCFMNLGGPFSQGAFVLGIITCLEPGSRGEQKKQLNVSVVCEAIPFAFL